MWEFIRHLSRAAYCKTDIFIELTFFSPFYCLRVDHTQKHHVCVEYSKDVLPRVFLSNCSKFMNIKKVPLALSKFHLEIKHIQPWESLNMMCCFFTRVASSDQ